MNENSVESSPRKEQEPHYAFEGMDESLVALRWENFLKRIATGMPEHEARALLMADLEELRASGKRAVDKVPLLDDDASASVEELEKYLSGFSRPEESRFAENEFPELYASETDGKPPRLSKECVAAKQTCFQSYKELFDLMGATNFQVFQEKKYLELHNRYQNITLAKTNIDLGGYSVGRLAAEYQKLNEQCKALIQDIKEGISEKTKNA